MKKIIAVLFTLVILMTGCSTSQTHVTEDLSAIQDQLFTLNEIREVLSTYLLDQASLHVWEENDAYYVSILLNDENFLPDFTDLFQNPDTIIEEWNSLISDLTGIISILSEQVGKNITLEILNPYDHEYLLALLENHNITFNMFDTTDPNSADSYKVIKPDESYLAIDGFTGFEQFVTIPLGTTMEEAIDQLGDPNSTITSDTLGNESITSTWWVINPYSLSTSETITFTNGIAASILSTADTSSIVNATDFDQIMSGMSETDVYNLLGAPYSVMVMDLMGMRTVTASWINADFSSGTITFVDGKVYSSITMNLE